MKNLYIYASCLIISVSVLVYTSINECVPAVESPGASIENLNFKEKGGGEKFRIVTADFDVVSGEESNGEIKILIDGQQIVNNRLIVKKGDSHYSVDFILRYPFEIPQRLFSATASLVISGTTNDSKQSVFMLNSPAIAGTGSMGEDM